MKTYRELLEDTRNKAKNNPKTKVVIAKELKDLSDKEIKAIYRNDSWIIAEEELFSGSITSLVREKLATLLKSDLPELF